MLNKKVKKISFICAGIILSSTLVLGQNTNQHFTDLSTSIIENIYDIIIDSTKCYITEETYSDGTTDIIFSYENNDTYYRMTYDKSTSSFLSLTYKQNGIDFEEKSTTYDSEKIIEQYTEAQNIYYSIFGENSDFLSSAYQCNLNEEKEITHGNVNFFFEQSDGNALKILYNVENNIFWNAVIIPYYADYLLEFEATSNYREENNIERVFVELN